MGDVIDLAAERRKRRPLASLLGHREWMPPAKGQIRGRSHDLVIFDELADWSPSWTSSTPITIEMLQGLRDRP